MIDRWKDRVRVVLYTGTVVMLGSVDISAKVGGKRIGVDFGGSGYT